MFGIPLEVISMGFSTTMGAIFKLIGQSQQDRAEQHKMMLQQLKATDESMNLASMRDGSNGVWIRRFIVVTLLMFVGFILVAPVVFNQPVSVPIEVTEGWLFWQETFTKYVTLQGIVTPEWLKYCILDIVAFYFGTSSVARSNSR